MTMPHSARFGIWRMSSRITVVVALAVLVAGLVAVIVLLAGGNARTDNVWTSGTAFDESFDAEIAEHEQMARFWRKLLLPSNEEIARKTQELVPQLGPALSEAILQSQTEQINEESEEYKSLRAFLEFLYDQVRSNNRQAEEIPKNYVQNGDDDNGVFNLDYSTCVSSYLNRLRYSYEYYLKYLRRNKSTALDFLAEQCERLPPIDSLEFFNNAFKLCGWNSLHDEIKWNECRLEWYYRLEGNSTNGMFYFIETRMDDALQLIAFGPICYALNHTGGDWKQNFEEALEIYSSELSKSINKLLDWTELRLKYSWANDMPARVVEIIMNSTTSDNIFNENLIHLAKKIQSTMNKIGELGYAHEVVLMIRTSQFSYRIGSSNSEYFRIPPTKNLVGIVTRHKLEDAKLRSADARRLLNSAYKRRIQRIVEMPLQSAEMYELLATNASALLEMSRYVNTVVANAARSTTLGIGARCRLDDMAIAGHVHSAVDVGALSFDNVFAYKQPSLSDGTSLCAMIAFLL